MITMRVRNQADFSRMENHLGILPHDSIQSRKNALQWWLTKHFKERFEFGNAIRFGYTPNTAKYEARKFTTVGAKPQLVRSGALRDQATKGTVSYVSGKYILKFNVPEYGKFLIQQNKNWKSMDLIDQRRIQAKTLNELRRIRSIRVK